MSTMMAMVAVARMTTGLRSKDMVVMERKNNDVEVKPIRAALGLQQVDPTCHHQLALMSVVVVIIPTIR